MRCKANSGFAKHARVTDYFDPADPSVVIGDAVIQEALDRQQKEYDELRYKELMDRVLRLEKERTALEKFKQKAKKLMTHHSVELNRLKALLLCFAPSERS